jgi:pimeloyl-ACP methyl ester carboxylesterase
VTTDFILNAIDLWRKEYYWRDEKVKLNQMPQFTTSIEAAGFGKLDMHFVHSRTSGSNTIPLLFLHGRPGSFAEVRKILPLLNETGFDVVAPSLPGYGFSSYPETAGFKHKYIAEMTNKLRLKLGYDE